MPNNDNSKVWKSLDGYNNDPKVEEGKRHEFKEGVTEDFDLDSMSKVSRRKFLALMSASTAFAVASCTDYQDKGEIIPYNRRPEEVLPGHANYYASTCTGCGSACGTLVKTREGRPIKIDGNPDHPVNKGKICTKGQASILNLYDPERLQYPTIDRRKRSWNDVDRGIINALNSAAEENKEIALVTHKISSPTTAKVLEEFKAKYPAAKVYRYDMFSKEARTNAWEKCYGSRSLPKIKWNEADVVVAFEADFLSRDDNQVENTRLFTERKDIDNVDKFNRLYVVEGAMSLTGMNADYRLAVRPDSQFAFVMALLNELGKHGVSVPADSKISKYNIAGIAEQYNINKAKLRHLVEDLLKHRGKAIVYAGDTLPEDVHIAVNVLNEALGNTSLYDTANGYLANAPYTSKAEWEALVSAMNAGNVGAVIHFNTNPVYHLPNDYGYADALGNVGAVITMSELSNETAVKSNYVLPLSNQLESWGDYHATKNVYSLQQPVISPIFDTRQKEAMLLTWVAGSPDAYKHDVYHKYLMNNFNESVYNAKPRIASSKEFWYAALHDGVVSVDSGEEALNFNAAALANAKEITPSDKYVVHLQESYFLGDGKFSNNGWLQETPHPVSKISWDNYAALAPATAEQLGVKNNDYIEVTAGGKKLTLPAFVQPGTAEMVVAIELSYGRKNVGDVADGVGFDSNKLLSKNYKVSPYIYNDASVVKAGGSYELVSTQEHHSLNDDFVKDFQFKRGIIKEGTVEEYKHHPHFLHEGSHDIFSITEERTYDGVKWAMAIDLNKCISCAACVTACNAENNVPVVGKDQVARGREMHWMRIDRYYSGTPDEPKVSNQPMLCQQCDNAPCENVCPVNATNHSEDGINQMVYNRCVGTRYCANNCPYKVRRFNFYDFRAHFEDAYYDNDLTGLMNNPEVTVRSRGVMEKCTFCYQRVMEARQEAIKEGDEFVGQGVVTACQDACPSQAIEFGNVNDPGTKIAEKRHHNLSYHVLEELNVKPNVTYLAKLRNTHSEEV